MTSIAADCCCEGPVPANCDADEICQSQDGFPKFYWDQDRAEYITIGRPRGPTVYPGTFWPAWHNTISTRGRLNAVISITVTKRTLVQTDCGAGGAAPAVTLPTTSECSDTGFMAATAGWQQTTYTDRFAWSMEARLPLIGRNPDQVAGLAQDDSAFTPDFANNLDPSVPNPLLTGGMPVCSIPEGFFPCAVQGPCAAACADPDAAFDPPNNDAWWAGENRKLLPRFGSSEVPVSATPVPSSSYPQVAGCGSVSYQNRCSGEATQTNSSACIDFPIVVIPSHSGTMCDGQASIPCDWKHKWLGSDIALWGFDISEPRLMAGLDGLGWGTGVHVGTVAAGGVWLCRHTATTSGGKLRVLFNAADRMPNPGDTLKFRTDVTINENKTGLRVMPTSSYRITVTIAFRPVEWCNWSPGCNCSVSYAENAPTVLHYDFTGNYDDRCGGFDISLRHVCALEDVSIGGEPYWISENCHRLCGCGTNCTSGDAGECAFCGNTYNTYCWQWNNLPAGTEGRPDNTYCNGFFIANGTARTNRYLGDEPLERGHIFWRRYRNRYNHRSTVNDWYTQGPFGAGLVYPTFGDKPPILFQMFVEAGPWSPAFGCCKYTPTVANVRVAPCFQDGQPCCGCLDLACDPDCVIPPTGCNGWDCMPSSFCCDVKPSDYADCPPRDLNPSYLCGPTPAWNCGNGAVANRQCYWIQCVPEFAFPNPFHRCGAMMFEIGGQIDYSFCVPVGGTTRSIIPAPTYLIVPWYGLESCDPRGNWDGRVLGANNLSDLANPGLWFETEWKLTIS